jgi:MFS family permease
MVGFSFISGKISDRFGRGGITNTGLLLLIIGSVLLFWTGKTFLILASVGLALGFAVLRAVTFALVGDIAAKQLLPAVNAYLYVLMNVSVVTAIAIGGFGWLNFLKVVTLLSAVITLVVVSPILKQPLAVVRGRIEKEVLVGLAS